MQQISNNVLLGILVIVGLGFLLYFLSPILTPFLVGAFFAYLADPFVTRLERLRIPRIFSVIVIFFIMFALITILVLILIPLIQEQIDTLSMVIPNIINWLQDSGLPWIEDHLSLTKGTLNAASLKEMVAENWTKAGGMADAIFKTVLHSSGALMEWLVLLLLIPVVTFYLMCDWDKIAKGMRNLLPRRSEATIVKLTTECNSVLSAFFRGQLLVMLALGVFYSFALSMVGLTLSVIIGSIAGLMSLVPYLGSIVGIVVATVAAYVQFHDYTIVGIVWGIFALGHLLENAVLSPYLIGQRIGLHPVAVIFAVLAGGCLFGFIGVLLALPVAAMLMVWIRYLYLRYRSSQLYHAH